jgi:hypothetical protein
MFLKNDANADRAHGRLLQRHARVRGSACQSFIIMVLLATLGTGRPVLDMNDERVLWYHGRPALDEDAPMANDDRS